MRLHRNTEVSWESCALLSKEKVVLMWEWLCLSVSQFSTVCWRRTHLRLALLCGRLWRFSPQPCLCAWRTATRCWRTGPRRSSWRKATQCSSSSTSCSLLFGTTKYVLLWGFPPPCLPHHFVLYSFWGLFHFIMVERTDVSTLLCFLVNLYFSLFCQLFPVFLILPSTCTTLFRVVQYASWFWILNLVPFLVSCALHSICMAKPLSLFIS